MKRVSFSWILVISALVAGCDATSATPSIPPRVDDSPIWASQMVQHSGQCSNWQLWHELWPLARQGNGHALKRLAEDMFNGSLEPPGDGGPYGRGARKMAHAFALTLYAANARVFPQYENIEIVVRGHVGEAKMVGLFATGTGTGTGTGISYHVYPWSLGEYNKLWPCFGEKLDAEQCLAAAVAIKDVPKFLKYKTSMDNEIMNNRNTCG